MLVRYSRYIIWSMLVCLSGVSMLTQVACSKVAEAKEAPQTLSTPLPTQHVESELADSTETMLTATSAPVSSPINPVAAVATPTADWTAGLAWLPAGSIRQIRYTDWHQLKDWHGVKGINSNNTPLDVRVRFMSDVTAAGHATAMLDGMYFPGMRLQWGWDSTDLAWGLEARTDNLLSTLHVLQLRHDFDMAALQERLQEVGFDVRIQHDIAIYHVPLTEMPAWHDASPLAMHTIGVNVATRQLILSPSLEMVEMAVAAAVVGTHLGAKAEVRTVLESLQTTVAGVIYVGEDNCQLFGPDAYTGAAAQSAQAALMRHPLQAYLALGAGFTLDESGQTDTLVYVYSNQYAAETDLAYRQQLLAETSPQRQLAYNDQFSLQATQTEAEMVLFRLTPTVELQAAPGRAQNLASWLLNGDGLFAGCAMEAITVIDKVQ